MTKYIKFVFKNKEPLRIADDNSSQSGQMITLRYIPGTTIRGYIVNQLVENQISTLIVGYNKGWKQDTNLKAKNNQNWNVVFD